MPLIRKIIDVGKTSKAVILPKSWLEYCEKDEGKSIDSVAIEVGRVLTIEPVASYSRRITNTHRARIVKEKTDGNRKGA